MRADAERAGAGANDANDAEESPAASSKGSDVAPARSRGPQPVSRGRGTIKAYSHSELKAMVRWVEKDTLRRTRSEVVEVVFYALGFKQRRQTILDAIGAAVDDVRGGA